MRLQERHGDRGAGGDHGGIALNPPRSPSPPCSPCLRLGSGLAPWPPRIHHGMPRALRARARRPPPDGWNGPGSARGRCGASWFRRRCRRGRDPGPVPGRNEKRVQLCGCQRGEARLGLGRAGMGSREDAPRRRHGRIGELRAAASAGALCLQGPPQWGVVQRWKLRSAWEPSPPAGLAQSIPARRSIASAKAAGCRAGRMRRYTEGSIRRRVRPAVGSSRVCGYDLRLVNPLSARIVRAPPARRRPSPQASGRRGHRGHADLRRPP